MREGVHEPWICQASCWAENFFSKEIGFGEACSWFGLAKNTKQN